MALLLYYYPGRSSTLHAAGLGFDGGSEPESMMNLNKFVVNNLEFKLMMPGPLCLQTFTMHADNCPSVPNTDQVRPAVSLTVPSLLLGSSTGSCATGTVPGVTNELSLSSHGPNLKYY